MPSSHHHLPPAPQPPAYVAPQQQQPATDGVVAVHMLPQHQNQLATHGHYHHHHHHHPGTALAWGEQRHPLAQNFSSLPYAQHHHYLPHQQQNQPLQMHVQPQPSLVFVSPPATTTPHAQPHATSHYTAAWPEAADQGPPYAHQQQQQQHPLIYTHAPPSTVPAPVNSGAVGAPAPWQHVVAPSVGPGSVFVQHHLPQPQPPLYQHPRHQQQQQPQQPYSNSHHRPTASQGCPAPTPTTTAYPASTSVDVPPPQRHHQQPCGPANDCSSNSTMFVGSPAFAADPSGPRQVIVNGIATATTADDVREVFEAWTPGCVERVNLPLRRSGHHRGYAFVYLADPAVAARAIVELTGHSRLSSEVRGCGINVQWANQRAAAATQPLLALLSPSVSDATVVVVAEASPAPSQHASASASSPASSVTSIDVKCPGPR